jgi:F0F1-type ATP synthase membrane subunit b/b'
MKRLILTLTLAMAIAPGLTFAQDGEKKAEHGAATKSHEKKDEGSLEIWKWVNFLILAGGLGYMIGKNAGPFFASRSASIRKDMEVSLRQREEAEARAAEVERRLATLEVEIAKLRSESESELKAGAARIAQQTSEEMAKIQAQAGHEIAAAGKQARSELKRYSAELAMGLAEQKVRSRMTPGTQDELVDSFVRDLK